MQSYYNLFEWTYFSAVSTSKSRSNCFSFSWECSIHMRSNWVSLSSSSGVIFRTVIITNGYMKYIEHACIVNASLLLVVQSVIGTVVIIDYTLYSATPSLSSWCQRTWFSLVAQTNRYLWINAVLSDHVSSIHCRTETAKKVKLRLAVSFVPGTNDEVML